MPARTRNVYKMACDATKRPMELREGFTTGLDLPPSPSPSPGPGPGPPLRRHEPLQRQQPHDPSLSWICGSSRLFENQRSPRSAALSLEFLATRARLGGEGNRTGLPQPWRLFHLYTAEIRKQQKAGCSTWPRRGLRLGPTIEGKALMGFRACHVLARLVVRNCLPLTLAPGWIVSLIHVKLPRVYEWCKIDLYYHVSYTSEALDHQSLVLN